MVIDGSTRTEFCATNSFRFIGEKKTNTIRCEEEFRLDLDSLTPNPPEAVSLAHAYTPILFVSKEKNEPRRFPHPQSI